ncbi:MAG: hypothetical protein AABX14_01010 [Candidatus Aenigmatarchaeota archaeon]
MPLCGFNKGMITGIAIFAEGLFEATLQRAKENNVDIETSFRNEVRDITEFLNALEREHQKLKLEYTPKETMGKIVKWIDDKDSG